MIVKFDDLPKGFKEKFKDTARKKFKDNDHKFNATLGTEIIRDMTNMDITYYDHGWVYEHDDIFFKNEYEYTLFLLKFSNES